MREIKFRAWLNLYQEMVMVDEIKFVGSSCCIKPVDKDFYTHDNELMQCTGLKDKNGRDIFENDILHIAKVNFVVGFGEYEDGEGYVHYGWYLKREDKESFNGAHEVSEVIGNIYENGDLLNG